MKFVDVAEITICSGKGGDGAVTFRREPFVSQGGPDGGNGGKGGDVIFLADRNLRTLMDFRYRSKYAAEPGQNGSKSNRYGKKGKNLVVKVPVGTIITEPISGRFMHDLASDGDEFVAAIGGRGGLGNSNFKNSKRQAPNFAEAGESGTERAVKLELKLIADVGLVGFPNVGKSTLLSVASAAKPKIADYPFTTMTPNLGVVNLGDTEFVLADIPGLIEGAARGAGLGHDFLKHVERTRLLIHVIDASGAEGRAPSDDYVRIRSELAEYSPRLTRKPQIAALNKMDVADRSGDGYAELLRVLSADGIPYYPISAATKEGVPELIRSAAAELARIGDEEAGTFDEYEAAREADALSVTPASGESGYRDIHIEKDGDIFALSGKQLKKIFDSTNFNDYGSLRYLWQYLVKAGAIKRMKTDGLRDGDTVRMYGMEFDYEDE
ncbi:MAG: GTPase ObgE [Clostridiales Family XIII bacterium]|jgi:GTP-binding protein|nr:GTPase ObgE [Clostridiales Family XIII bacterium]